MPPQLLFWQGPNGLCAHGEVIKRAHELMNEIVQLEENPEKKNSEFSPMQIPFFLFISLFVFSRIYMEAFFPLPRLYDTYRRNVVFLPLLGLELLFLGSSIVRHLWVTFLVTFVLPWMFKEQ